MSRLTDQVVEIMRREHGENISAYDRGFLELCLQQRMREVGSPSDDQYAAYLTSSGNEAANLRQSLHVDYSEFFRDSLAIALLEQVVLPILMSHSAGGAGIRVWSAGCAQGQEAYSIAILFDALNAARQQSIPYRVFATDTCEEALTAARYATYSTEALQNLPLRHLHRCLIRAGADYRIRRDLSDHVDFSVFDLTDPHAACPPSSIYGGFDLTLCSNVLTYYRDDIRQRILNKLYQSLLPHGLLVTGSVERDSVEAHGGFRAIMPPAPVFRKRQLTKRTGKAT